MTQEDPGPDNTARAGTERARAAPLQPGSQIGEPESERNDEELRSREAHTLGEILDQLDMANEGADGQTVSLEEIREVVGHRAFGPFLLVVGLLALTPIGVIPGVPTTLAVIVVLMGVQMLLGLRGLWLPGFVLHRSVAQDKLAKSVRFLRPVARATDKVFRPRLTIFTDQVALHVMAATCVLLGLIIPPLEFVPFAVTIPALALILLGLGLITRDGLLALAGFAVSGLGFYLIASNLLF